MLFLRSCDACTVHLVSVRCAVLTASASESKQPKGSRRCTAVQSGSTCWGGWRPWRFWQLGDCPTPIRVEGPPRQGHPRPTIACGAPLRAREDATRIRCPQCHALHNVHRLLWARKSEAEAEPMTQRQLVRYNRDLPPEFQVPPRTLAHWLATGRLLACGEDDGDPLYSWIDVRLLVVRKPQTAATGAAAHGK